MNSKADTRTPRERGGVSTSSRKNSSAGDILPLPTSCCGGPIRWHNLHITRCTLHVLLFRSAITHIRIIPASHAPWRLALQHPRCTTHNYRRHKAGVPVMTRLQREHRPPLSAAACLALPPPLPARLLASVGAGQMLGIASGHFPATKLRVHSSIPKPDPPFQRTVPVHAGRPAIFKLSFPSRTQQVRSIAVDGRT